MDYTQANPGRIFAVKFQPQEDILVGLKDLIRKENIKSGIIYLIGAISNTEIVVGPKKKEYPPTPVFWKFDDAMEILSIGLFAWQDDEPKIHLHASMGNKNNVKTGCIRNKSEVYLTIEGIILEFIDTNIVRKFDAKYNASLLEFE